MEERVTLQSIAGYDEEKEEAKKLIDILKNFEQYRSKGASIPKGLILCGEPGVGKTLFAKAIASESGVPLFEFEANESVTDDGSVEGLKAIFNKARESVPSIVFIDELDELVSSTDTMGIYGYQSDYSRKTLKTLLTEIDGISSSDGILVIATTNSKRTVPPALIRSGRLEKQITFRMPTLEDRASIARLYLDKIGANDISEKIVASKTNDFSGADIKSLVNSSLIEALRKNIPLSIKIIESVIPTIRFGEIKKKNKLGPSDAVCYHEIGHFLAQYALDGEIGALSVESYGDVGGTMLLEEEFGIISSYKKDYRSSDVVLDTITVSLGGIAGEEVFLGKRFCGSASDISSAVRTILTVMNNGVFGFEFLPTFQVDKTFGGHTGMYPIPNMANKEKFSRKIVQILDEKLAKAKDFVKQMEPLGRMIYPLLKEKEVLSKEELKVIVDEYERRNPIYN